MTFRRALLYALLGIVFLKVPAAGVEPLRTVVLSGTQVPGGDPGELLGPLHGLSTGNGINLALNNQGEVAFVQANFYSEGGGQGLKLIARPGEPAPDTPLGVTFHGFPSAIRLLDDGTSYVAVEVQGPGIPSVVDLGVWMSSPTEGLRMLYRDQMITAGFDRLNFANIGPVVNQQGAIATTVQLFGPGVNTENDHSVWAGAGPDSLGMVIREGETAPGLTDAMIFGDNGFGIGEHVFSVPQLNDQGTIAFIGRLKTTNGFREGIWSTRVDANEGLVAVERQSAPGLSPAHVYTGFAYFAQSEASLLAFVAVASVVGTPGTGVVGLWKESASGNLQLVVHGGQEITVDGRALRISTLLTRAPNATPGMNSQGVLTFIASLGGDGPILNNDDSLWRHDPKEGFQLIAREGSAAPGTEVGTLFGKSANDHFRGYVLNKAGQVAFAASLRGPGVSDANDYGIWATDLEGNLRLVVREGDTIDVNDGDGLPDLRVISALSISGPIGPIPASTEMGLSSYFNDRGQIAFTARFADGSSGVFVSDFVMVPEPGFLGLAVVGVVLFLRRWA